MACVPPTARTIVSFDPHTARAVSWHRPDVGPRPERPQDDHEAQQREHLDIERFLSLVSFLGASPRVTWWGDPLARRTKKRTEASSTAAQRRGSDARRRGPHATAATQVRPWRMDR